LGPSAVKRVWMHRTKTKMLPNIRDYTKSYRSRKHQEAACDIDIVAGSGRPPMYRLRMGEFRAMYFVEDQAIFVTDLFPKKRDSFYRQN